VNFTTNEVKMCQISYLLLPTGLGLSTEADDYHLIEECTNSGCQFARAIEF